MSNGILSSDVTSTTNPAILEAMETVWGHSPHPFQLEAIQHLCFHKYYNVPPSVLWVQGTAAGKSTIMQMALMITCGVSLAIMPLLALASDQESKIKHASQDVGPILSFHLDEYRQQDSMHAICNQLLWMQPSANMCVYLFASLQCLLHNESPWLPILIHLYHDNLLSLVGIDETHLYLEFGQSFYQEFQLLQDCLFSHLRLAHSQCLGCPVLMTATFTYQMLIDFKDMVGFKIPKENYVWADSISMQH